MQGANLQDDQSPASVVGGIAATLALHVLDNLLEGCQVVGFDHRYLYLNEAAARQGRRSRDELLGRTMTECYPGIENTAMFAVLERCLSSSTYERMENEFTFADGSSGWFELQFIPVPAGICILSLDVTKRKQVEKEVRRAHDSLRLLIDGARDHAIYLVDPGGRVLTWNAGAERLKGYSSDEIIGSSHRLFFTDDDLAGGKPEALLAAARADGRAEDEGYRVRKNGERFWANVVITALESDSGEHIGFAKITRDLSQFRKLEEQMRHAQKMEAVGRLAGGIAHDFNNLLSVVLSYSSLAVDSMRTDDPLRGDIEEIMKAGQRAADLTRQLLAFSRQSVIAPQVVELNQSLSSMERMLRRICGEDITLSLVLASDLGRIKADPSNIEQVVMNLVVNARDAMPEGGRLIIETSNVDLDDAYAREHLGVAPGGYVMMTVSDTGIGMDRATQKQIFEPFFTTKVVGKGTGLGLSTVFGIVNQLGGSIWVYSEPGHGTTFKVHLPRTDQQHTMRPQMLEVTNLRGDETILVTEDDDQLRVVACGVLRKSGYTVLEASNGGEALLLCEEHPRTIHLLLTDVAMPKMSGARLAQRLGSLRPDMRVLFMSGYTEQTIMSHGFVDDAVELLQKPITPDKLLRRVRQTLDAPARPVHPAK